MVGLKIAIPLCAALSFSVSLVGHPEEPRRIEITASKFSYSPNEITVKKGEPVVLVLHSTDVTHGLTLPELKINAEIKKGKDTEVPLTPTQTGQFKGRCAFFCGPGHGSMTIEIDVVE